ncbi:7 transmembrane receptor (rhodopsin family) protein [Brugia pahangi]
MTNCTIIERLSSYLTAHQIIIAIVLIILIFFVIVGNTLVILSVIIYKRMRTFTNKLLTSLATADLLVGLFVMPLSLLDLLLNHAWPFDMLLCKVWSTSDVLFCTASILNLCVISIDRYLAISKPLKYSRTRNRKTAALLLGSVWLISFIVCTPPWIFHFDDYPIITRANISAPTSCLNMIVCGYPSGIMYRIYSSMASFFIPLLLMCSVYYKIFRIISTREKVLWKSINLKSYDRSKKSHTSSSLSKDRNSNERYYSQPNGMVYSEEESISEKQTTHDLMYSVISVGMSALKSNSLNSEMKSNDRTKLPVNHMDTDDGSVLTLARIAQHCYLKLQPRYLLAKAHDRYQTCGPGKFTHNSREKIVYMKERKALKTIAILFFSFSICWLPFFVIYLIEVLVSSPNDIIYATQEVFLWLGYSNSVLNPIIYTMYNHDFRRCFRDLLTLGFMRKRRSMSIRKLHQQSNC